LLDICPKTALKIRDLPPATYKKEAHPKLDALWRIEQNRRLSQTRILLGNDLYRLSDFSSG
jgi:hypothetical protein